MLISLQQQKLKDSKGNDDADGNNAQGDANQKGQKTGADKDRANDDPRGGKGDKSNDPL